MKETVFEPFRFFGNLSGYRETHITDPYSKIDRAGDVCNILMQLASSNSNAFRRIKLKVRKALQVTSSIWHLDDKDKLKPKSSTCSTRSKCSFWIRWSKLILLRVPRKDMTLQSFVFKVIPTVSHQSINLDIVFCRVTRSLWLLIPWKMFASSANRSVLNGETILFIEFMEAVT